MRSLIKLVNDNHMDNYLKEIFAFVYCGLIVKNQPKIMWHLKMFFLSFPWKQDMHGINFHSSMVMHSPAKAFRGFAVP